MTKTKTMLIRTALILLSMILIMSAAFNSITIYTQSSDYKGSIPSLLVFIFGVLGGLFVRIGLSLLFLNAYRLKYPEERLREAILKKVIFLVLALSISSVIFPDLDMLLVFIICTLATILKVLKKAEEL